MTRRNGNTPSYEEVFFHLFISKFLIRKMSSAIKVVSGNGISPIATNYLSLRL